MKKNPYDDPELLILDLSTLWVQRFTTEENKEKDLQKSIDDKAEQIIKWKEHILSCDGDPKWYIEKLAEEEKSEFIITTYGDYLKRQRDRQLSKPLYEISRDEYWEFLEVLPPMNQGIHHGLSGFFMSEFQTGSFTRQFVQCGKKYYSKMVDYNDKETWIKPEQLKDAINGTAYTTAE